jgi:hypothetical protein
VAARAFLNVAAVMVEPLGLNAAIAARPTAPIVRLRPPPNRAVDAVHELNRNLDAGRHIAHVALTELADRSHRGEPICSLRGEWNRASAARLPVGVLTGRWCPPGETSAAPAPPRTSWVLLRQAQWPLSWPCGASSGSRELAVAVRAARAVRAAGACASHGESLAVKSPKSPRRGWRYSTCD